MDTNKFKLITIPVGLKEALDKAKLVESEPYQSVISRALKSLSESG